MTEIVSPFQQFFGTNGAPLSNGNIYIGTANLDAQSNPIPVYWDEAFTIPAPQPIQTLNGYPVWNGAPARFYVSGDDYSISVRNAQGRLMYSASSVTGSETLRAELAASNGAGLVGFIQAGVGAVSRTAEDKMRDTLHAKDFGVTADGVTDDSAALAAWWTVLNESGKVGVLPAGVIRCNSPVVWDISAARVGGLRVEGPSVQGCIIDVRTASATADGAAQFLLSCNAGAAFYSVFSGFTVLGNNSAGPAVRLGRFNLTDEFNGFRFSDIEFKNTANNANAIACEINGHYNNDFNAVTTNTGGTRVAGTSLRIRRAAFCRFFGSFSGAGVGLLVDGTFSFANAFVAIDIEEVDVAVRFAGSSNSRNTFVGGTFVANTGLDFQSGSGAENLMLAPNVAPYSGGVISAGTNGINIIGSENLPIGNVVGGGLYVVRPTGRAAQVILDGDVAQSSIMDFMRNNSLRWRISREVAEPGGNVGGNLFFEAFSDAGVLLGVAASMERGSAGGPRLNADRTRIAFDLEVPTYTVATLPSANPGARVIYVSNESGGSVLAFSDGANWRRVTDRAIVT